MIVIRSGRNPYAIFLLVACVLTGVSGLISPRLTSPVVAHLLASWELYAWYGGLFASGSVALAGLSARGLTSLLVERVGLVVLASLSAMSAVAVAVQGGAALSFSSAFVGCFAVASVVRVWQIGQDTKKLQQPRSTGE